MKLKTKAWLVSQGLLIITALIIQLTIFFERLVGPILGMPKDPMWKSFLEMNQWFPKAFFQKIFHTRLMMRDYPFQKSRFVNPIFPCIVVLLSRKRDFDSVYRGNHCESALLSGIPSSLHLLHKYTKKAQKRTLTAKVFIFCVA